MTEAHPVSLRECRSSFPSNSHTLSHSYPHRHLVIEILINSLLKIFGHDQSSVQHL